MYTMKRIMIFAMAVAALASCKHEQSELNFSDIQGSATIKGQVTYMNGVRKDGNSLIESATPAANVPVIAKIAYKEYSGAAEGTKIIEAITDSEGKYSIVVPCGQTAINVEVEPRGFTAPYFINTTGTTIIETKAFFQASPSTLSVVMGDELIENFDNLTSTSIDPIRSRNTIVNLKGDVSWTRPADHKDGSGKTEVTEAVEVVVSLYNSNTQETIAETVTCSGGKYNVSIKIFDSWDVSDVIYTVIANAKVTSYKKSDESTVNGYLNETQVGGTSSFTLTSVATMQGMQQTLKEVVMTFIPVV